MSLPSGVGSPSARWLFSEHFLEHRLPEWREFVRLDAERLRAELGELWQRESRALVGANEGETEERLIRPVLRALGHSFQLFLEIPGTGKAPDYFLYASEDDRVRAERLEPPARIERSVAVADAKRFELPLDRRSPHGDPVAQIRDYMLLAQRTFGILTNGRIWRLYARESGLVERSCHEVDLGALLEEGDPNSVRYFAAFFGAQAFVPAEDGRTFLERALEDSHLHAVDVSDRLERAVFDALPAIASGLLGDDPRTKEALQNGFAHTLVFLYRVLFCLFAEARDLLPVHNLDYRRYSVTQHRLEVVRLLDEGGYLSPSDDRLYASLNALFRTIDRGDAVLGVTEYDGGLFAREQHPWLEGRSVPDALLAPALDGLYRVDGAFVDYRDLSVRTLGSVYEKLLAWELAEQDAELVLIESPRRHELGSYFTPEPVVDAIVERTLDPLVTRRSQEVRRAGLTGEEALEALLSVRVLDPAMGSAHFLVGAVEFVAQAVATDPSYDGDLSLAELRRLVAERCLYGVDVNPLAVELARLSLWLVTARQGEPLTFLGNLRVGDSLVGADTETLLDRTTGLLESHLAAAAADLLRQTAELQRRATHTGADAREKRRLAREIDGLKLPLSVFAEQSLARFRPPPDDPPGTRPRLHWPLEFPEVFVDERGEPRDDGGFDAIVGNPPYIRVQEIGRAMADYCRARFETARGSFDAYLVFLERAVDLLGPHGRLGFIVPNKLFKLDFAERMRALLSERELIDEVLDFGASQVFPQVTNYTCILVLDRGGVPELAYRRVRGSRQEVLDELSVPVTVPAQRFVTRALGSAPWLLVPPEEAALIEVARAGSERLDAVTAQIFQGLITSADDVYVLEDRGQRAGLRVVWSRASHREHELEPDLLRPLASGVDVDRFAFRSLPSLLLFPYVRDGDAMQLIPQDELAQLPLTDTYLREHEAVLRAREGERMDHDSWYAFGRTQSLGLHDLPKLGVAATVRRLEVAADLEGAVSFHNVRVNGILGREDEIGLTGLLLLLNTRLLDWIFRRGSAPHANEYFAANKQFIAGLPIRIPESKSDAVQLRNLGSSLHEHAAMAAAERGAFLRWLASTVGVSFATALRREALAAYERVTGAQVVAALWGLRPPVDPRERAMRELIEREHAASSAKVLSALRQLADAEREADALVYELYGLPTQMRALVDAEYT